jgi:hypothetical protein
MDGSARKKGGKPFRHEPLDRGIKSIRTLQILPRLAASGMIQCEITHTTIEQGDYHCLSYAWGEPEPCRTIMVNGKRFTVRQNLYDFLCEARTSIRPSPRWWIDAICIDQQNGLERNHQVQQMGQIYSKANCVYIWLGKLEFIPSIKSLLSPPPLPFRREGKRQYRYERCEKDIYQNAYWGRAWVVQEITLAKTLKVFIKGTALAFRDFLEAVGYLGPFRQSWKRWLHIQYPREPLTLIRASKIDRYAQVRTMRYNEEGVRTNADKGLLRLVNNFRTWECAMPRDRIFSLIALCREGKGLMVDYDISDEDVAYKVLKLCTSTVCICTATLLGDVLGLSTTVTQPSQGSTASFIRQSGPFLEVEVTRWELPRRRSELDAIPYYEVDDNGLICFDLPLSSPSFPELGLRNGNRCPETESFFEALCVRAVFVPAKHTDSTSERLAILGEEIRAPRRMRRTLRWLKGKCQNTLGGNSSGEMRVFAQGFSFATDDQENTLIRVSLDLIWNLTRDRSESICESARRDIPMPYARREHIDKPPWTHLGHGSWNTFRTPYSSVSSPDTTQNSSSSLYVNPER